MTIWPKCSVCNQEITSGKTCRSLSGTVVAHEECTPKETSKVRRMNEARAWAITSLQESAGKLNSGIPSSEATDGR
jgi:hypothetical protein